MLEQADDKEPEEMKSDGLASSFVTAIEVPQKERLHSCYQREVQSLNDLQCRATFFNMLAFGYKSYSDVTKDIEMTTDSFS